MQAIVFDFDGTLVDSRTDITVSIRAALQGVGIPCVLSDEAIGAMVGCPLTEMLISAGPTLDTEGLLRATAAYRAHFTLHCQDHSRLYDGVVSVIRSLRGRVLLGCATTKRPEPAGRMLEAFGLQPLLDAWRGTAKGMRFKPAPDVLLAIAADLDVEPAQMAYVGDTASDLLAARAAGALPVWARWGYGEPAACAAAEPALVLEQPRDLLAKLAPGPP